MVPGLLCELALRNSPSPVRIPPELQERHGRGDDLYRYCQEGDRHPGRGNPLRPGGDPRPGGEGGEEMTQSGKRQAVGVGRKAVSVERKAAGGNRLAHGALRLAHIVCRTVLFAWALLESCWRKGPSGPPEDPVGKKVTAHRSSRTHVRDL